METTLRCHVHVRRSRVRSWMLTNQNMIFWGFPQSQETNGGLEFCLQLSRTFLCIFSLLRFETEADSALSCSLATESIHYACLYLQDPKHFSPPKDIHSKIEEVEHCITEIFVLSYIIQFIFFRQMAYQLISVPNTYLFSVFLIMFSV